jgi:hypothetical protein
LGRIENKGAFKEDWFIWDNQTRPQILHELVNSENSGCPEPNRGRLEKVKRREEYHWERTFAETLHWELKRQESQTNGKAYDTGLGFHYQSLSHVKANTNKCHHIYWRNS